MLCFPPRSSRSRKVRRPGVRLTLEPLESRALLAAMVRPTVSVPDLTAASDSGWSTFDNKTNVLTPTFTGTATNASSVQVFDGKTSLGTAEVVNNQWTLTAPPRVNGNRAITAQAFSVVGGLGVAGPRSRALVVTINTKLPTTTILLAAHSDTGVKGDFTTRLSTPTVVGRGSAGSFVTVSVSSTSVGWVVVPASGLWTLKLPAMSDGVKTVSTKVENVFGSQQAGGSMRLTIDTVRPIATLAFVPGTDTITVTFNKPVTGVTLRNLSFSGQPIAFAAFPAIVLTDPKLKAILGPGKPITMRPGAHTPSTIFTVTLPQAFAESGRYTLKLATDGIMDAAGNPPVVTALNFDV